MRGWSGRWGGPVAVSGLIVVSTVVRWLAGRRLGGLWILPDEGIYSTRATDVWVRGALPLLHGGGGYGILYPLLVGAPLSLGSVARGYATLKIVQAVVVSLAAVPVFVFGRRLMSSRYALIAAVLTVASPLLLYSGLVMTEVLFYPVAAWTLLGVAEAVHSGTVRSQAWALALILVAVLTRPQAVVFTAVFAAAIVVDALAARELSRLSRFWPTWLLVGGAVAALGAFPSLVGSYAGTLRGGYPFSAGLRLSAEHLSFVALASGLVPCAVLVMLVVRALRGYEQDPAVRALLAVCTASCVLLPLQVGFFAARYAPHLLGRDLAPLPPLLFVVFALWLGRGAPRGRLITPVAAFAALSLVLLVPWNSLVVPVAFADSFDLLLVSRVHGHQPINVVTAFSVVMLTAFTVIPRRAVGLLPVAVLGVLIAASVVAANESGPGRRRRTADSRARPQLDRREREQRCGIPLRWKCVLESRLAGAVLEQAIRQGVLG